MSSARTSLCVADEMVINEQANDTCGKARTDRIAREADDAGEAAAQRALAARRGEAAGERVAELRAWGGHSPCQSREAANRAANASIAAQAAGKRASEAYERAAAAHEDAADAHDRAAERERDMTRAIEHRHAAARDRTAASDDRARSQHTTAARSG